MIKIGIIGFGVVGSGVYEVIRENSESIKRKAAGEIDIKYILDIRDFSNHAEANLFINDFNIMLDDDEVKIVVEVMGGLNPAYEFTKKALLSGKSVVTSNKELVATYGDELLKIASENNVYYLFEASVGGGIPIIRPLNQCLAANEISEIVGILNGTTNYILTQMIKNGVSFEDALKDAQAKGYAEKNPEADVEGHDTCRKICILTSLAFGKHIDYKDVYTEGISAITLRDTDYANELGYVIKLLGYSKKLDSGLIDIKVAPMFVSKDETLATVDDVYNGILVKGNAIGDAMFYGRGAGKLPTASAVVADVIDIAKNPVGSGSIMWTKSNEKLVLDHDESLSAFFVRLKTTDKIKALSDIKKLFSEITIIDKFDGEVGFITKEITEGSLCEKLSSLEYQLLSNVRILN